MNLYLVENRAAGRRYVAVTKVSMAVYRHRLQTDARRFGVREEGTLLGDIAKYGIQNVHISLIEQCDQFAVRERKIWWIDYFKTRFPDGYNAPSDSPHGGAGALGARKVE